MSTSGRNRLGSGWVRVYLSKFGSGSDFNSPTTKPPKGMGSHVTPILPHNSPLLINRPTRATHESQATMP